MPKTKLSKAEKLIEEYRNVDFESSSAKTEQFKGFSRKFKNAVKEQLGDEFELVQYSPGHFYVSGFIQNKQNGEYLYFSISDVRHFPNEWFRMLLLRKCKDTNDYRGSHNNFVSLTEINELANRLS